MNEVKYATLSIKFSNTIGFESAKLNGYEMYRNDMESLLDKILYMEKDIDEFCVRLLRDSFKNLDFILNSSNKYVIITIYYEDGARYGVEFKFFNENKGGEDSCFKDVSRIVDIRFDTTDDKGLNINPLNSFKLSKDIKICDIISTFKSSYMMIFNLLSDIKKNFELNITDIIADVDTSIIFDGKMCPLTMYSSKVYKDDNLIYTEKIITY